MIIRSFLLFRLVEVARPRCEYGDATRPAIVGQQGGFCKVWSGRQSRRVIVASPREEREKEANARFTEGQQEVRAEPPAENGSPPVDRAFSKQSPGHVSSKRSYMRLNRVRCA